MGESSKCDVDTIIADALYDCVSRAFGANIDVVHQLDFRDDLNAMVLTLRSQVYGVPAGIHTEYVTRYIYASWWQHFKDTKINSRIADTWFGRWYFKRWPVRRDVQTIEVKFNRYLVYPDMPVPKDWGVPSVKFRRQV